MRTTTAALLGLAVLALTACSNGSPAATPGENESPASSTPPEASVDASCGELTELAGTLTELNANFDPNTLLDSARAIDAGLESLDPPPAVAAEWAAVASIFGSAVTAADAAGDDRAAQEEALAGVLDTQATPESVAHLDTIAAAIGEQCGGEAGAAAGGANETCALVTDDELAALFGTAVPAPSGSDLGEGFAECEWEAAGTTVLVSVLPAGEFTDDYLNGAHEPVSALEQGTALPDFVGIGRVGTTGGTVAQITGESAYLFAVMTPDESVDTALAAAESLAVAASARLG
ncbi:hypothetical protein [Agromyces subbeticus]|uniref:hypothetical protein n=1 Tax=Agromyces subbeticus TaxID=293890 RepID=UPI0003B3F04C|nr:hypothetical protein [Agromyces subbeticus]